MNPTNNTCVILLEIQDIKMNEMAQVAIGVYTSLGCAVASELEIT